MPIIYSIVARKDVVLTEYTSTTGNFTEIAKRILSKIPQANGRQAYAYDRHTFDYIVQDGITFMCMTDEHFSRRVAFAFLEDIKKRWSVTFGTRGQSAAAYAMNDEFSHVLRKQMDHYSNDTSVDKLAEVQKNVDDVKNVMVGNIEKVLDRQEKIELLVDKTDNLNQNAFKFKKSSTALKRSMCMKNVKLGVALGAVTDEHRKYWFACALYVAGSGTVQETLRGGTKAHVRPFSLSHLLKETSIRLVDFFEPLKSFISFLRLGDDYHDQLKILEKNFVVICILYQKYEKMFGELIKCDSTQATSDVLTRDKILAFGWNTFLVAKGKLLKRPLDLIDSFQVLVCVLDLLLTHVPDQLRGVSLDDVDAAVAAEQHAAPSLAYLCRATNANVDEVCRVQTQLFGPLIATLRDRQLLQYQPARVAPHGVLLRNVYLGGLLDAAHLEANCAAMAREYDLIAATLNGVNFDERLFIHSPQQIGSPTRVSSPSAAYYFAGSPADRSTSSPARVTSSSSSSSLHNRVVSDSHERHTSSTLNNTTHNDSDDNHKQQHSNAATSTTSRAKRRIFTTQPTASPGSASSPNKRRRGGEGLVKRLSAPLSPPSSPHRRRRVQLVTATPISAAQASVEWLKNCTDTLPPLDDTPPPSLVQLLTSLIPDATSTIDSLHQRLSSLLQNLNIEPETRKVFAGKLYYLLLEKLVRFEQQRLGERAASNLAALLTHELFHKSLLACCVEIVIVCYKMPNAFPWITDALGLEPFDMYKIIETAVRHLSDTPRTVVRHLNAIEQTVLQQTIWSARSPVWSQLVVTPLTRDIVRELCSKTAGAPATVSSGLATDSAAAALSSLVSSSSQQSATTSHAGSSVDDDATAAATTTASTRATPSSPVPTDEKPSHSLLLLYRKVLQLVAMRTYTLCRQLLLPIDVFQEIWSALVHALTTYNVLKMLMRDRHIDQIIMATIYGVCKVQARDITFRRIIEQYRRHEHAVSSVFRDVLIRDEQRGDIIQFYNRVYIPIMEMPLLELHRTALTQPLDTTKVGAPLPPQSQLGALGGNKLLLSPMSPQRAVQMAPLANNSSNPAPNKIASVTLSIGGTGGTVAARSESHALQQINETINSPRTRRAPKRLFGGL